jgi:hypothetical protein
MRNINFPPPVTGLSVLGIENSRIWLDSRTCDYFLSSASQALQFISILLYFGPLQEQLQWLEIVDIAHLRLCLGPWFCLPARFFQSSPGSIQRSWSVQNGFWTHILGASIFFHVATLSRRVSLSFCILIRALRTHYLCPSLLPSTLHILPPAPAV